MNTVLRFQGPDGVYDVSVPRDEDTPIEVVHGDLRMQWPVQAMNDSGSSASGLTHGTAIIWGDVFWFEFVEGPPAQISYYGDGVLVRTDQQAKS